MNTSASLLFAAVVTVAQSATGETIRVPADYPTIQEAIDAATSGDEIVVDPGTYGEAIDLLGKAVHLRSVEGPSRTKIDASGLDTTVVRCVTGEGPGTTIEGFTITGGVGVVSRSRRYGGGLFVEHSSPTVVGCVIRNNQAHYGAGIWATSSDISVLDCIIAGNAAYFGGGGMRAVSGEPNLRDCVIKGNWAGFDGGGLYLTCNATVVRCAFNENSGFDGGAVKIVSSEVDFEECSFLLNESYRGGGMFVVDGEVSLVRCTFYANAARFPGGAVYHTRSSVRVSHSIFGSNKAGVGGAIYTEFGETSISQSTFERNSASWGGALTNEWGSVVEISESTFRENFTTSSWGDGGAVWSGEDTIVTGCSFEGNSTNEDGGAIAARGIVVTIQDCSFRSNHAGQWGGAVYVDGTARISRCEFLENSATCGGGFFSVSTILELRDITFDGNRALGGSGTGGGAHLSHSSGYLDRVVFLRNRANRGGGIFKRGGTASVLRSRFAGNVAQIRGGGIHNEGAGLLVANAEFSGNAAEYGGGVQNWNGSSHLVNCTFSGNLGRSYGGGVLNTSSSSAVLLNCILWGNEPEQVENESGASALVQFSDVQGGWVGDGNIDADAMFIHRPDPGPDGEWGTEDDEYGDLHIMPGSPCIDAADNTAVPLDEFDLDGDGDTEEPTPFDLGGHSRHVDDPDTEDTGRCGSPCLLPIVDMGAFEFQAVPVGGLVRAGGCKSASHSNHCAHAKTLLTEQWHTAERCGSRRQRGGGATGYVARGGGATKSR